MDIQALPNEDKRGRLRQESVNLNDPKYFDFCSPAPFRVVTYAIITEPQPLHCALSWKNAALSGTVNWNSSLPVPLISV